MQMVSFIVDELKLIASVTPRAGNYSMKALLSGHKGYKPEWETPQPYSAFIENGVLMDKYKDYKKIKLVINPYNRAVSCFSILSSSPKLKLWRDLDMSQEQAMELSFRSFLDIMEKKDLTTINHHFMLQYSGLDRIVGYYIQKSENINNEIQMLNNFTGLEFKTIYPGNSKAKMDLGQKTMDWSFNKIKDTGYEILEKKGTIFTEKRENRNTFFYPEYKLFFDEQIRNKVYNIYKSDIEAYNYKFEW